MSYKIEKVPLKADPKDNRQVRFAELVDTIRDLKVGESFVYELKFLSSHRLAVTVISRLLNREYIVRKEKIGMRIGRLT